MLEGIFMIVGASLTGAVMLAVQKKQPPSYGGGKERQVPTRVGFTMAIDVEGPPSLVRQVRASNVILGLNEFRASGQGMRTSTPSEDGSQIVLTLDSAKIEGTYKDEPYEFSFRRENQPDDLAEDPLKQVAWGLGMGGRRYSIGKRGEYHAANPEDDAQGEAMGLLMDPIVRFPDNAVEAGQEWVSSWKGERQQAENGAFFSFEQKSRIEEVEPDSQRVRISYQLNGRLEIPEGKNDNREDTTLQAKGIVLFDAEGPGIVTAESSGSITTSLEQAGLKLVRKVESKFEELA